jgi:hypothetical protein
MDTADPLVQSDLGLDEWKVSKWDGVMRFGAVMRVDIRGNGKPRGISSTFIQELQKMVCNLI